MADQSGAPDGPPAGLSAERMPGHVAVIMDGNGRWAEKLGLDRLAGHRQGAESVRTVVRAARRWGIRYLTLYAFSEQNWSRPQDEIAGLMELLADFVRSERDEIMDNGIRLVAIGDLERLPQMARLGLEHLMKESSENTDMTLSLALSYGGREEILAGVQAACDAACAGDLDPASLDEDSFRRFLWRPDIPDPDLVVRTSGELRISNFLLWQIAYSEFHVTETLWPDFGEDELALALRDYATRERRFGKTGAQLRGDSIEESEC